MLKNNAIINTALTTQFLNYTFWYAPRDYKLIFVQHNVLEKLVKTLFTHLFGFQFSKYKMIFFYNHVELFIELFATHVNNRLNLLFHNSSNLLFRIALNEQKGVKINKHLDLFFYNLVTRRDFKFKYKQLMLIETRLNHVPSLARNFALTRKQNKRIIQIDYIAYRSWFSRCLQYIWKFISNFIFNENKLFNDYNFDNLYNCCKILFFVCLYFFKLVPHKQYIQICCEPRGGLITSSIKTQIPLRSQINNKILYFFNLIQYFLFLKTTIIRGVNTEFNQKRRVLILIYQFYIYTFLKTFYKTKNRLLPDVFSLLVSFIFKSNPFLFKKSTVRAIHNVNLSTAIPSSRKYPVLSFKIPKLRMRLYHQFKIARKRAYFSQWRRVFTKITKKTFFNTEKAVITSRRTNFVLLSSTLLFFLYLSNKKIKGSRCLQYMFFNYLVLYLARGTFQNILFSKTRLFAQKHEKPVLCNFTKRSDFFKTLFKPATLWAKIQPINEFNFLQSHMISFFAPARTPLLTTRVLPQAQAKAGITQYMPLAPKILKNFKYCLKLNNKFYFSYNKYTPENCQLLKKNQIYIEFKGCTQKLFTTKTYIDFKAKMYDIIQQINKGAKFKSVNWLRAYMSYMPTLQTYTFEPYQLVIQKDILHLNLLFLQYLWYFYSFYHFAPAVTNKIYIVYQQIDTRLFTNFLHFIFKLPNSLGFLFFKQHFRQRSFTIYLNLYLLIYKFLCVSSTLSCDLIVDFMYTLFCRVYQAQEFFRCKRLLELCCKILSDFINSPQSDLVGVHLSLKGRLRKTTQRKQHLQYRAGTLHYTTLDYKIYMKKRYIYSSIGVSCFSVCLCFKGKNTNNTIFYDFTKAA